MEDFNHGTNRIRKVILWLKHFINMYRRVPGSNGNKRFYVFLFSNSALSTKDIWEQSLLGSSCSGYFFISPMEKGSILCKRAFM